MTSLQISELLKGITADSPCGDDLEYSAEFGELERSAAIKPEQQIGDNITEAVEPDWKRVHELSLALLAKTHDLRITIHLIRAALHTDGLAGLRDGLALLLGQLEQYWDALYPLLDAEDDNDPTLRINTLSALCNEAQFLHPIRCAPLVESRMLGRFSLRDIAIARGQQRAPEGYEATEMVVIEAAFKQSDPEKLQATATAIDESIAHIHDIEHLVTEQVGLARAASFAPVARLLDEARQVLGKQLEGRGMATSSDQGDLTQPTGSGATAGTTAQPASGGEIRSRDDVVRTLERVEAYYNQHEPSSPIPLLLARARRLVPMNFTEIINDIAPEGANQVNQIRGPAAGDF